MKFFAYSAFEYIRQQVEQQAAHSGGGRLMFMMPSLPPDVVLEIGNHLAAFCAEQPNTRQPLIKVAAPLACEWMNSSSPAIQETAQTVSSKGWCDETGNLTGYRNLIPDDGSMMVVLLIGVDRVTDASSMADFHHCDLRTIWEQVLGRSFAKWIRAALDPSVVGYDDDTVQCFDSVLQPLVERGVADVLQISTLLQNLNLSAAQDGRDAEKVLLMSLGRFNLPEFGTFKCAARRGFGAYIDDALAFFSYDAFLEDRSRQKAIKAIDAFVKQNDLGELFDQAERRSFATDQAFMDGLRNYIATADAKCRADLLRCDYVTIRDRILPSREDPGPGKPKKQTVSKLSGGPVEVMLSALWTTLGEFKRSANERGVFAHEALKSIHIEAGMFKHDCDGESSEERKIKAVAYLGRLLGGVDQFIEKFIDTSRFGSDGRNIPIESKLVRSDVECQSARSAEPFLQFSVTVYGEGWEKPVVRQFAWRLPEIQPYRVADELLQWGAEAISAADGYCLPVFHVPYYEELMLAKDDEETRRVLLHCVHDEGNRVCNLFDADDLDGRDPLLPALQRLAFEYDGFIQKAKADGLHAALLAAMDGLRKAYERACDAYVSDPACGNSPLAALLFRSFLIIARRRSAEGERWMWEAHEPSCAVTVLHPALLEMLQAHVLYLLTSFTTVAAKELTAPGSRAFRDLVWQGYVDLAAIQMPLTGLIKDRNRVLDTDVRGENLIHRIGAAGDAEASLTTRLLLRYDAFDEDDISDTELFRRSRESMLICRILEDYRKLHPHADDGLSIAVYQNQEIQPLIAAVDDYLQGVCATRSPSMKAYAMTVTVFTESSDDSSVSRWVGQWKERWEAAESQASLAHYRQTNLSIAHRIVSPDREYRQFIQLVNDGLQVDIALLNGFIRAGTQGNDFELVEEYDVRDRTLKFPILEKSFCAFRDPGRRLQRARVLSNRQFRLTTFHAELMARLKSPETPQNTHHVVLGYGDYTPWQGVVDALHQRAEWLVCVDPNIDERLIAEKGQNTLETREIIGFGSGVGAHGEANFTISTEQFRLADVLHKLDASIQEVYSGWTPDVYQIVSQSVLAESRRLSGLSLVRATGIGQYVRDFMAYSLTRKLLQAGGDILCDQIVSLDAYQHWFDSADTGTRPDLLWIIARIGGDGRLRLDMRLIECKLAKMSDLHLEKAREQLENGIRHLTAVFMPQVVPGHVEDERPDQRYWWLQLHRLIASKAEIVKRDQKRVLTALERLAEGDYDVQWRAAAITYWTDQTTADISQVDTWSYPIDGQDLGIGVVSAGSEFVRSLCETGKTVDFPWQGGYVEFHAAVPKGVKDPDDEKGGGDSVEIVHPDDMTPPKPDAKVPLEPKEIGDKPGKTAGSDQNEIRAKTPTIPDRILLGTTLSGSRKVYWEFGHKELTNRHMLIFGSSGMGKTYTIQCLLCELGRSGQNSLIVDYTNGFFDNQLETEFKQVLSPTQHLVRKEPLTINPFRQQAERIGDELLPESTSATAQRVSGVFSEVYNFGDQQKSALYQAVKSGLEKAGTAGMTLEDLIPSLEDLVEQKGTVGQSAASVVSKIRPFVDQNPFGKEDPASWERFFVDAVHRCHVLQLAGFMKDAGRLVTEFSLIDLYWFYRGHGTQGCPHVIVLDEVQNLDHREDSPLAQLLREGRKFGFSLILATQIMSNLEKDERDRLFNAAHKLFFRPADTEMRTYAEIASVTTGEKTDVWLKRLSGLKKGECYSLGPSLNDASKKLEVKAVHIRINPLGERVGDA
jgi:DNA phosphorothioation-dependent restriction protein DptH